MKRADFFMNGQAFGDVATLLANSAFDPNALRPWIGADGQSYITHNGTAVPISNASTLRKDEWKQMDEAVIQISRDRLTGVADLEARGLVYNIGNGLGTTVLEHENISDMNDAEVDMDAETEGRNDRVQYDIEYLPLPITHKDFRINIRQLEASRTRGAALDTTQIAMATRKVAEKLETFLFQGSGSTAYTFGGGSIYGYETHPSRVTGSITADWDDSGADPVTDVLAMKQALLDVKKYGPYGIYIPSNFETALDEDYGSYYAKTVRQRILEIGGIEFIKVADYMTADEVIMVQLTQDTVRMVNAMPIAPIQWDVKGGMVKKFKVWCIKVPQIRADQDGNCGVCHYT